MEPPQPGNVKPKIKLVVFRNERVPWRGEGGRDDAQWNDARGGINDMTYLSQSAASDR